MKMKLGALIVATSVAANFAISQMAAATDFAPVQGTNTSGGTNWTLTTPGGVIDGRFMDCLSKQKLLPTNQLCRITAWHTTNENELAISMAAITAVAPQQQGNGAEAFPVKPSAWTPVTMCEWYAYEDAFSHRPDVAAVWCGLPCGYKFDLQIASDVEFENVYVESIWDADPDTCVERAPDCYHDACTIWAVPNAYGGQTRGFIRLMKAAR
jgi:hypothetical protein